MEEVKRRNKIITDVAAVVIFVLSFAVCAVLGRIKVIDNLFSASGDNLGETLEMSPTYSIVCFLFVAVLCVLAVFGLMLKNKLMVLLSITYEALLLLSFISLGLFATGNIENQTLYRIVMYVITVILAPVYGVIWNINMFFFVIYVPLVAFNIFAVIRVFKSNK